MQLNPFQPGHAGLPKRQQSNLRQRVTTEKFTGICQGEFCAELALNRFEPAKNQLNFQKFNELTITQSLRRDISIRSGNGKTRMPSVISNGRSNYRADLTLLPVTLRE